MKPNNKKTVGYRVWKMLGDHGSSISWGVVEMEFELNEIITETEASTVSTH